MKYFEFGKEADPLAVILHGGLLIFSLYPALPDQPPVSELQDFVQQRLLRDQRDPWDIDPLRNLREQRCV